MIDPAAWDLGALAASWRAARPFSHLVLDGVVGAAALGELRQAIGKEPHWPNRSEIFEMMSSGDPTEAPLRALVASLGSAPVRAALAAVTGRTLARVDGNSYVYLAGSYLLPHTDYRAGVERQVAYVYYLSEADAFAGGELDLYACALDGDEIVGTEVARTITPRADRLVLLDVGATTLHQVREVTSGARVSVAGWFYR